ncbi:MAG: beta-ketoacyl-[acyl-carrier-protein] synthase family protein [Bacteroidales bacterium]|nr:beta-ketoacyl-[acyl-carrier-protein] synthase family protein [Bacteroidales bacterium]
MNKHRVVITGLGVVSPLGCNVEKMFSNLLQGESHFQKPQNFLREYEGGLQLVSPVSDDYEERCREYEVPIEHSISSYSLLACKQAIENAGLKNEKEMLEHADLHIGTSESYCFDNIDYFKCSGKEAEDYLKGRYPAETLSLIASELNIQGEALVFPIACSGGNVSISTGAKKIKYGQKDICIVGSVDCISEKTYTTFHCLGALSASSCKPFDKKRDGITVGEGAGFLVLENLEHAIQRGVPILAEVMGYNISCDAYHLTTPDINGMIATKSIRKALEMAEIKPEEISYISPHGTGTYSNDLQEANAIFRIFEGQAEDIPVSGIKSILGHCMSAASSIEAIVATLSLQKNAIPETINTCQSDDTFPCKLNTANFSDRQVSAILSNSFAFGGNICSIVLAKYQ